MGHRRRRLVVFGGRSEAGITHHRDAWQLDLAGRRATWEQVADATTTSAPPPTRSCAAAWDEEAGRLLVYGGWDGTTMRNGVWSLDPDAGAWEQLCNATSCGSGPSPRRAAAAAFDPVRQRLVVVGGLDAGGYRNDVWSLDLSGEPAWSQMATSGTAPTPRASHTLTYDARREQLWLVAGTTPGADLRDVWTLDLDTAIWSPRTPAGCPATCLTARSGHVTAIDPERDRLMVYGGLKSDTGVAPSDVWTFSDLGGSGRWTRLDLDSAVPQPRFVPVAGYDRPSRRLVVFAGGLGSSAYRHTIAVHVPVGALPSWHSIVPATPFTARDQSATVRSADGSIATFGGFGSGTFPGAIDAGMHLADSWRLVPPTSGTSRWRNVTPRDGEPVPLAREAIGLAHDAVRGRTFLVGGLNGDVSMNDVWVVRAGGTRSKWRQVCSPVSCGPAPEPRWGGHAVWDEEFSRLVLFGGRRSDGSSLDDTWILTLGDIPRWQRVETSGTRPAGRWGGAATYDPVRHRLVVFGGQSGPDSVTTRFDDTWSLSLDDFEWSELDPDGTAPSARRSPAYATLTTRRSAQLLVAGAGCRRVRTITTCGVSRWPPRTGRGSCARPTAAALRTRRHAVDRRARCGIRRRTVS